MLHDTKNCVDFIVRKGMVASSLRGTPVGFRGRHSRFECTCRYRYHTSPWLRKERIVGRAFQYKDKGKISNFLHLVE